MLLGIDRACPVSRFQKGDLRTIGTSLLSHSLFLPFEVYKRGRGKSILQLSFNLHVSNMTYNSGSDRLWTPLKWPGAGPSSLSIKSRWSCQCSRHASRNPARIDEFLDDKWPAYSSD